MGLLTWLIVGGIVGWLASMVIKGRNLGLIGNIVTGVIGALLGGWLTAALFNIHNSISGFNLSTFIAAFLGAVILLYAARLSNFKNT